MNTEQKKLCQELTQLMGYNTFELKSRENKIKIFGSINYFLQFDNKVILSIGNDMKYFNETIKRHINFLIQFNKNKDTMLQQIREQVIYDNLIAKKEGLLPVKVIDIGVITTTEWCLLRSYVLLEVHGEIFYFIEGGFDRAMANNKVRELLTTHHKRGIFSAVPLQTPTFIFANVRFSHLDNLYIFNSANI